MDRITSRDFMENSLHLYDIYMFEKRKREDLDE
jgi:hypothetical protein